MLTIVILSNSSKAISGLKTILELYMYEKMFPIDVKVCKEIKDILKLNLPNAIIFITDSKETLLRRTRFYVITAIPRHLF